MKHTATLAALIVVFTTSCASTGTKTVQEEETEQNNTGGKLMESVRCFGSRNDVVLYGASEYIVVVGTPDDHRVVERRDSKPTSNELNAHCPSPTETPETYVTANRLVIDQKPVHTTQPYPATVHFESEGAESGTYHIEKACFHWNQEGPYCFSVRRAEGQQVTMGLKTGRADTYTLTAYLIYSSNDILFKTNTVETELIVEP